MNSSFLFLPDISGYTRFVQESDAKHSRHVIAELLELLIEQDELGMTVAEIEGDAVFFHLPDRIPTPEEIARQARRMFEAFHIHLKRFERDRICECGACCGVSDLSLKFIAHAGPVETIRVRDFEKPYGPDVILAHRLLKNEVPDSEYLLMTEAVLGSTPDLPDWANIAYGTTDYDDVGSVAHGHITLGGLRSILPDPEPRRPPLRMRRPVRRGTTLPLPFPQAFDLVVNFEHRLLWHEGVDALDYRADRVNRVGTEHKCVIGEQLIEFETVTDDFGPDRAVYGERFLSPTPVADPVIYWILEDAGNETRVTAEVHYRRKGLLGFLTALIFRLAITKTVSQGLAELTDASRTFQANPEPTPI